MQRVESEPPQPTQKDFNLALDEIVTLLNKQPPSQRSHAQLRRLMQKYVHIYVSSSAREDMFALFCQHDFLKVALTTVTKFKTSEAYVIVIESLSLLSYNLKLDRQIVFFLSRPELHQIIDIMNVTDPEAVDVYVQFLKSFAMRFKGSSYWKIFYNSKYAMFPLMWQAIRFYRHEQKLIRTTVRSIILEISKIKAFSMQAYLNNFPFCIFYAWEAQYIFSLIQSLLKCQPPRLAQALIDDIMDELTFLQDLSEELIPETRAHMWNAFLYFAIKPLWVMFINQEHKQAVQENFLLLILMIIGQTRNRVVLEIFIEVFLGKWICNPIDAFFNKNDKTKDIQSFADWKKIQKCMPQMQEHSQLVYNKMNSEMFQVSEIVLSQENLRGEAPKKERRSSGFFSKMPGFLASMGKDYWINQQLSSLSEGLGVTIQLYNPISSMNMNNLYSTFLSLQPKQKQQPYFRRTINPIYSKIQKFIDWDRKSYYVFTQIYLVILSDPHMASMHKLVASYLTDQLGILMYELSRTKQAKCIVSLLQTLKVLFRIGRPHEILLEGDYAKLLKLTKDLYLGSLLHVQNRLFNEEWAVHIEAFQEMQTQSSLNIDRNILRMDISLLEPPPSMPTQKLQAMWFYLIRYVASILNTKTQIDEQPFRSIFNELKSRSDPGTWAPYLHTMAFRCEGTDMVIVPQFENFKIVSVTQHKPLIQGEIKNCTVIKELEGASQVKFCVLEKILELEFKSPAHRDTWVEGIQTIQRSAYELQIQAVVQMLEQSPA